MKLLKQEMKRPFMKFLKQGSKLLQFHFHLKHIQCTLTKLRVRVQ